MAPVAEYAIGTSSSGTFTTTETVVDTVTAPLITGKLYEVLWTTNAQSSVANDVVLARIREDALAGTQIMDGRVDASAANVNFLVALRVIYTAVATGNKTFVGTFVRSSGTGNVLRYAAATSPSTLSVRLWR